MILAGHDACDTNPAFERLFRATVASPGLTSLRASARSLTRHVWTFDDGRKDIVSIFRDHFEPHGLTFQFFVCPRLIDEWEAGHADYVRQQLEIPDAELIPWDAIGRLVEAGNVVGSHGVDHTSFSKMGRAEAIDQLERSRQMIRARLGHQPTSFAFPFGSVQPSSLDAANLARNWYDEVHLSDNALSIGELADGVFNRRHSEFGTCAMRGLFIGALNIVFGVKKWRS